MSVSNNKALTRRFYDGINQGNLGVIDELIAEDFVDYEGFPGMPTKGPEAVKAVIGMFKASFSDIQFTMEDVIADDDKVVVRGRIIGTHDGDFMGIPPTDKKFDVSYIDIIEVRDGQATAHWGVTDQAAMMQQLGLAPEM